MAALTERGVRFAIAGAAVAAVYMATTTALAHGLGVDFQAAIALAFALSLALHFTLQRLFVWRHQREFALALHHQLGRFLLVAALQYVSTAAAVWALPQALGVSVTAVYVITTILVVGVNFLVFGTRVFHPARDPT